MPAPSFDLRPMAIGDLLDRTLRLYRRDVLSVLGIIGVVSLPIGGVAAALGAEDGEGGLTLTVLFLLNYFGVNVALGALTWFVSERILERPADLGAAYRHVLRRAGALSWAVLLCLLVWAGVPAVAVVLGLALPAKVGFRGAPWWLLALMALGILALIPAAALSILAFFRLSLVPQVVVLEDIRGRAALARSWRLMRPNTGRAIVLLFFWGVLRVLVALVLGLPARGLTEAYPQTASIVSSVASTLADLLTLPVLAIGFILLYYDSRIRQEAFDLEMMARTLGAGAPPRPPAPAPARPAPGHGPAGTILPAHRPAPDAAPPPAARGGLAGGKACPQCQGPVPLVRPACPRCGAPVPFRAR